MTTPDQGWITSSVLEKFNFGSSIRTPAVVAGGADHEAKDVFEQESSKRDSEGRDVGKLPREQSSGKNTPPILKRRRLR